MSRPAADRALVWSLRGAGALSAVVVVLIMAFLAAGAGSALQAIGPGGFLGGAPWQPARSAEAGEFGLWPMVYGTGVMTLGAMVIAAPVGLASALFCRFYGPSLLVRPYRRLLELLAGIPSVVYGFWGIVALVPLIGAWQPPGASLLAGTLVLGLMILPTLALLADSAIAAVPADHHRSAAAVGLSRWSTIAAVILPAARSGLMTAAVLATGRALGETMAVLMVAGNVPGIPTSVFEPVRTLTVNIALELGYASGVHRGALFVTGLVLMAMVSALMMLAWRLREPARHG